MKQKLTIFMFLAILLGTLNVLVAQTYFPAESFESAWSGTLAAPTGWTQVQIAEGSGSGGNDIAWERSTYSGGVWSPAGNGTKPTSVPNGSSVAHYNDYNARSGQIDRLFYNSDIDLSGASFPRVQFSYFYNSGSASLQIVGSNDGGNTWNNIGSAIAATGSAWAVKSVNIPAQFKVSNFRIGFQVTAAWSSNDLWLDSFTINEGVAPLSGIKTIDPAGSGANNYTSFTAAINALNDAGIGTGGVTFNVKDGAVFTEECPAITATGTSDNPIIFQRDNSGSNRPVIKPTTSTAGIQITGGDYITFDGIDIMVNSGSTPSYGYYLIAASATNGAQYNTIKNCSITLNKTNTSTKGVYQYSLVTPTSAAGANSYNKYQNITVENSTSGIYCYGASSTYPDLNNEISGCTIGGATADNMAGAATGYGVYAYYQSGIQIFKNEIRNFTTSSSSGYTYGVYLYSCFGTNAIHSNKIHDLKTSSSTNTYAQYGIYAYFTSTGTNTANIYNNMVWNISSAYTGTGTTSYLVYGIYLNGSTATNTYNVDFNSIRIVGPVNAYSAGVYFAANTAKNNLRNNIIANYTGAQSTYKHVGVYFSHATTIGATGSVSDRNVIYIDNSTNGYVVRGSATDYANLAAWTTASTQDGNSKISNPQFTSATNLYIRTDAPTPVEGNGSFFGGAISWVPNDIDGARTVRNTETPDIGAHEGNFMREVECEIPAAQATNLVLVPGTTTISGSFTASDAEAYLVVSHTEASHSATPTNGTFYTAGSTIGNGTVVQAATGITFTATGLTANTRYYFTIYAYNASGLNAPKYLVAGPLTGSMQTLPGAPANPASVTATAVSSNQINIVTTANATNDNVIIAWNTTNTFGTPLATGYSVGGAIAGGGTVLYMGPAGTFNHTSLSSSTTYYYKVWSYITADRTTYYVYSTGLTANARTFIPTITNFPYIEGFENGNTHSTAIMGWEQAAVSGSDAWTANTSFTDYNRTPRTGSWNAFLKYSNSRWMFKPVQLQAGTAYRVSLYARQDGATASNASIGIKYGTTATPAGMTNTILAPTGIVNGDYQKLEGMFTPTSSGIYFLGILGTINSTPWYISIDDITIEEAPSVLEPSALTAINITASSADLGWTENNSPAASQWDIIYGAPGFNPATAGTLISGVTSNPYRLTGLTPSTTYHWYVRSVTTGKAVSTWGGPGSFTTAQIPATLPFSEGFEVLPNNWTVVNGTQTNQWHVGGATFHAGEKSAYISNDGGTTNNYNTSSASVVHLYRDIAFTADSKKFDLEFWWKGLGESASYDYLQVFLIDPSISPVAGTRLTSGQIGANYNSQSNWTKASIALPGTLSGATKRLVFSWWNDNSGGTQPPIAIDDILLTATPLPTTPVFIIDPVSKNFGNQQINASSAAQVFTIRNEGISDLIIGQAISLVGDNPGQFELIDNNSYPYTINSGHPTLQVSVAFKPTSVGQKNAKLKIVDNTTREVRFVELEGNGIDSTIRTFPWTENFDAENAIPAGWTVVNVDGGGTTWGPNTVYSHSSPRSMGHVYGSGDQEGWLITPPIVVPQRADGKLTFKWWNYCQYPGDIESSTLCVNTTNDPNDENWVELWDDDAPEAIWREKTVNLEAYAGKTIYLAFIYMGDFAHSWYIDDLNLALSYDYPEDTPITVGTGEDAITITMEQGAANNVPGGTIPPVNNAAFVEANGFVLALMGTGPWTIKIQTTAPWGAFYRNGAWTAVENTSGTEIIFNIPAAKGAKAGIEIPIVLGDKDPTLPVTLSSFTAVLTADMHVKIAWIAESETDHAGYNLLRSEVDNLATAIRINHELIDQGNISGSQIAYSYTDSEVYPASTYYYWLESQSLSGETSYYGSLKVEVKAQSEEPELPVIPLETKLYSAFPNPFNPNTNLRYSMKEAGEVSIQIYNVKGQLLRTYRQHHDAPGYYQVSWDGRDDKGKPLSTGVYFYRMTSGKYSATKKMVLSK